ncbi:MAG: VWA domain-containing protein [Spirosomaceae bacterium]|nr:VWA domain-containing protein [Spirosomataceae bacterium]
MASIYLSRTVLIKNEMHYDLFDRLFGEYFKNIKTIETSLLDANLPPEWFQNALSRELTDEEKALIEKMGGLDKLFERFQQLLREQQERHDGGNRWIGTGGTSAFGNNGHNPEGFRVKGESSGNRTAAKVWEHREYKNYDENLELNTRNIKMALRRLRILTREGMDEELDMDETIAGTCRNGGILDIHLHPSRKNNVKVLLLLDVGGSMDEHIELCSELFSAAKYQFKHLEHLYFHNCVYETLWRDNTRRHSRIPTLEVLHKYNKDYKVIFVGDASMASYEITHPRGSVEHYNEEAGITWLDRFKAQYPDFVWLNPVAVPDYWKFTHSIQLIRDWSENRMFPLTLGGLTQAMKCLKNSKIRFEG